MTEDNYFSDLNRTGLIAIATEWASENEKINRITLHHYKNSDIYKYLVLVALEGNPSLNNTMPDLGLSPQDWPKDNPDANSQIESDIIWNNFTHEKTFADAFIGGKPPADYNNQWFVYPIFDGEPLPEFASSYSWEIYPGIKSHIGDAANTISNEQQNAFIRQGGTWQIYFNGEKLNPIPHMDGLSYIAEILKNSPVPIHVTTLYNAISPQNRDGAMMTADDLTHSLNREDMSISEMRDDGLDKTGKGQILNKLKELKETIDDNALPESERNTAQEEYDSIMKNLSLYGKKPLSYMASKKANHAVKNDMDKVKKAIDRAINKIRKQSPELADYLRDIDTGEECRFKDTGITWNISF